MNPLLLALPGGIAIPILAALAGGIVYLAKKADKSTGQSSSGMSTASELSFAQFLNSQAAQGQTQAALSATQAQSAQTASLVNNFNPNALISQDLQSSGFQSSIAKIVDNSTGALQTEINALNNVVAKIPKSQTVVVKAPAPPGPNPGPLGINTWF